jgi:hypothetical protein
LYRHESHRYLDECGDLKTDYVRFNSSSLSSAEKFFVRNRAWTASQVLTILEKCGELPEEPDHPGHDPLWYARHGRHLGFLIPNIETTAQELGLSASLPLIVLEDLPVSGNGESESQEESCASI